jgi:uncharacterized protein (DUF1697 family)
LTQFVAFLRAVNVGKRTVAMADARSVLEHRGLDGVQSYLNSGNLIFTASGKAAAHESVIRAGLESRFGFEVTTFVRTAKDVGSLAADKPFGAIAAGHTHFVLLTLTPLTTKDKAAVEALSNDHDDVVATGRDIHWLIRSKSTETTLGSKQWGSSRTRV